MSTFNPPAWIATLWDEAGEPIEFVSLRACTGRELDEALRHADQPDTENLRNLWILFKRACGHDNDTISAVLRLPAANGALLRPQFLSGPKMNIGTGDAEFRRKLPLRRTR